jgi:hypothetical protein
VVVKVGGGRKEREKGKGERREPGRKDQREGEEEEVGVLFKKLW